MDRDEITMMVAANIEGLMKHKKLSPPRLAEKAKLNPTAIYDIISGKSRSPRLETISKIANALEVPISMLFEQRTDAELRSQIIEAFARLTSDEKTLLLQTARAWSDRSVSQ